MTHTARTKEFTISYRFDPDLADVAAAIPLLDVGDPVAARHVLKQLTSQMPAFVLPDTLGLETHTVSVGGMQPDLTVHVITPKKLTGLAPGILWFHGGGFVLGDALSDLQSNAELAEAAGAVVVSAEYRLAPENPYPAAIDDGYAALTWMANNADSLGIDSSRMVVAGLSAGACVAAGLSLLSRDRGGPEICFQALNNPVLDDELSTPSMTQFNDTPNWTKDSAAISWKAYLGPRPTTPTPAYAAPARSTNLAGLPPAFISACEFDPLRDEAIEYAQRLVQASVPVELHLYPGTFHGSSAAAPWTPVSQRMQHDLITAICRAVSPNLAALID